LELSKMKKDNETNRKQLMEKEISEAYAIKN
jgi:hypothetical protein